MIARLAVTASVFGILLGCGGGNTATQPSVVSPKADAAPKADSSEVATGTTLTKFQKGRLLGHYSTMDGASGFILDRTVTPWRGKLDGTTVVVTLSESNTPSRGVKEYKSADKSIWIRVDVESGDVLLFQGPKQHQGVSVTRDAEAEQLK